MHFGLDYRFELPPFTRNQTCAASHVRFSTQVGGLYRRLPETRPKLADHVRGRGQSERPTRAMTSDSAWPSPELYKRRGSSSVKKLRSVWVFFMRSVPASRLHLPGPAYFSTLALWTPPFSTQEHDLHTCGCGQNNATIVGYRTTEHPSPETPRYRKL